MKSFLNKVTNPVVMTIAPADEQRDRFMATAARMEDVSLQAAGTPAAVAIAFGLGEPSEWDILRTRIAFGLG